MDDVDWHRDIALALVTFIIKEKKNTDDREYTCDEHNAFGVWVKTDHSSVLYCVNKEVCEQCRHPNPRNHSFSFSRLQ